MKKYLLPFLVFLSFIFNPLLAKDTIVLNINDSHKFKYAPYYMAIEKGFYKEVGLDVTIEEYHQKSENYPFPIYSVRDSNAIVQKINGEKIVAIGSLYQKSLDVFFTNKEIKSFEDLKDKKITINPELDNSLMITLKQKKISIKDYVYEGHANNYKDLLENKTHAISGKINLMFSYFKENKSIVSILDPIKEDVIFYEDIVVVSEEEAINHKERVEKFINATKLGKDYVLNNVNESLSVINKKYNSIYTENELKEEAKIIIGILSERTPFFKISERRIEEISKYYQELGKINDIKISNFLFNNKNSSTYYYLTEEEQNYLNNNTFTIGFIDNYPPFSYIDENGVRKGIIVDALNLIQSYSPIKLELKPMKWGDVISLMKEGKLDMFFGQENEEKKEYANFTNEVSSFSYAIYSKNKNAKIHSFNELENKKVVIVKGFAIKEYMSSYKNITIIEKNSALEALETLLLNEVDYYVDNNFATNYIIKKQAITDIFFNGIIKNQIHFSKIGIQKNKEKLLSIINTIVKNIPKEKFNTIQNEWLFSNYHQMNEISLTQEEKEWLEKNPFIKVGNDPFYSPFDYYEDDESKGFSIDMIKKVTEILEITPVFIQNDWTTLIKSLEENNIDILTSMVDTNPLFHYSQSYYNDKNVIVSLNKFKYNSLKELKNLRMAIPENYEFYQTLKNMDLNITFIFVKDIKEALTKIMLNEADITIESEKVIDYFIKNYGFYSLNTSLLIDNSLIKNEEFSFAFNQKNTILKELVNKALKVIKKEDIKEIELKNFSNIFIKNQFLDILNEEEKKYLFKRDVIKIGNAIDNAPYNFVEYGKPNGYWFDIFSLIMKKLNKEFVIINDTKKTLETKLNNGVIDFYIDEINTKNTQVFYSKAIMYHSMISLTPKNKNSIKLESGIIYGIIKGDNIKEYLENKNNVIEFYSIEDALIALNNNSIHTFIGEEKKTLYSLSLQNTEELKVEKINGFNYTKNSAITTQKENEILSSILDKALFFLPKNELIDLQKKWFGNSLEDSLILPELKKDELIYLKQKKVLKVGVDTINFPYDFKDKNGKENGISLDIISYMFKPYNNLHFEIYEKPHWNETLSQLKNKEIEIVLTGTYFIKDENISLTIPYLSIPVMIFSIKHSHLISNLNDIKGKKIGYPQRTIDVEKLKILYPEIIFKPYNGLELINAVEKEEVDYFLSTLPTINYFIKNRGISSIKLLGKTEENMNLYFAVHKENTLLLNILNKHIRNISESEVNKILDTWFKIETFEKINYNYLFNIAFFFFLIIGGILFWNRKMVQEIKYRKSIEESLIVAQQKAELATKVKSEFLSNMSHEIRTPMNAIIGFAELTSKMILPENALNNVKTILKASKALITILNDILDLSKLEAGKFIIQNENMIIKEIEYDLRAIFETKAKEKDIQCFIHFNENVPECIKIDEIRLRQILINLIGNAIKFTEKGYIKLSFSSENNEDNTINLKVDVEDTGIGIKEEDLEIIFNNFEQQNGQSNRKYGGTGLGLPISKKLANLMNGDLTVKSEFGVGTVFTLILHNIEVVTQSQKHHQEIKMKKVFNNQTIFIVDDIEDNLVLLESILKGYGFIILKTLNPIEGLTLLEENIPDLILTDIKMPIMDGYVFSKHIKNIEKLKHIPIVAVSASICGEKKEAMQSNLFNDFLLKPLNTNDLEDVLAKYLTHTVNCVANKEYFSLKETSEIQNNDYDYTLFPKNSSMNDIIFQLETIIKEGNVQKTIQMIKKMKENGWINDTIIKKLEYNIENFDLIEIENLLTKVIQKNKEL